MTNPNTSAPSDAAALERMQTSDGYKEGFETIYLRHYPQIHRFAQVLTHGASDADDVTQEVFIVLAQKCAGLTAENLGGWLWTVLVNKVHDHQRKKCRAPKPNTEAVGGAVDARHDSDPAFALTARDTVERIRTVLNELPDAQRDVFVALAFEGTSFKDYARAKSIAEVTARANYHRARQRVKAILGPNSGPL